MRNTTMPSPDHKGAIPIIDYNPRNEKLSTSALKERGYDQNGWPYAPCGILTRLNGFDFNCQRATFCCRRQCLSAKDACPPRGRIIQYAQNCPYWFNYEGFTKHMSIKQLPRLISEVIRGTYRHHKPKNLRSASESAYSIQPGTLIPRESGTSIRVDAVQWFHSMAVR
jgi:hypothetical protein